MGPEATAEFYKQIIQIFQKKYNTVDDVDYPEIYIFNLPLPDVVSTISKEDIISKFLQKGINKLTQIESDFIVCPCNTANTYFNNLSFRIPNLNLIDLTVNSIIKNKSKKIGILGTTRTISSNAFQNRLKKNKLNYNIPKKNEQEKITKILINILSGKKLYKDKQYLLNLITKFKLSGCDSVILGCTELPLLINQDDSDLVIYDTLQILAEATVNYSVKGDIND